MKAKLSILIACEESDEVRYRFEQLGFDAWSCDLQENRNPTAKHFNGDVFDVINGYYKCKCGNIFEESAGKYGCCGTSKLYKWDAMIAFPPCTHLAASGAAYFKHKKESGVQQKAIEFFLKIANADIKHIAIENPVGIMSRYFRKPDQIIHPYYFGDEARKKTCLWVKNLPLLKHLKEPNLFENNVTHVSQGKIVNGYPAWMFNSNKKHRSKTFSGIAQAMANQWGSYILENHINNSK
jgi:hypothetical protein